MHVFIGVVNLAINHGLVIGSSCIISIFSIVTEPYLASRARSGWAELLIIFNKGLFSQ